MASRRRQWGSDRPEIGRPRRALVTVPADHDAADVSRFLADMGIEAVTVDVSVEDPFVDSGEHSRSAGVDGASDFVLCLGPRSPTAVHLAMDLDVPLACAARLDRPLLDAVESALLGMSEIHRSVLDVRVDGVRRLVPGSVEVGPGELCIELCRRGEASSLEVMASVAVTAETPATGRVAVSVDRGPRQLVDEVTITGTSALRMTVDHGRGQHVDHLRIVVLDRPLREVVLGAGPRRRPIADLPAL